MFKLISIFVVTWFVFAIFDLSFDREIFNAYTATERLNHNPDEGLPRLLANPVHEYRVRDRDVVGRVGDFVSEYKNCQVFDRNNWSCVFSDESATFGARQGEYFSNKNLEKFPHLASYGEEKTLSRFGYILLQCRWDSTGGIDAIACLFRPFIT
jgi:hypothetical protein